MCYCRPEIRTAVCDNCAPTMYNVIIRLTAQLAERDKEIEKYKIIDSGNIEQIKHLKDQRTMFAQENKQLTAQLAERDAEIKELKHDLSMAIIAEQTCVECSQEFNKMKQQLAERDAEIAELNQIAKIHSNRYVEKVVHLTKQLTASQQQVAELQQEVERLKESVESWIKTAAENQLKRNEFADIADQLVASQQEVEALTECLNGSSKAVYTAEVFDAQMEKVRKQTARECYEMVCTDEYIFGARNLAKAIAAKFGLEG